MVEEDAKLHAIASSSVGSIFSWTRQLLIEDFRANVHLNASASKGQKGSHGKSRDLTSHQRPEGLIRFREGARIHSILE